MQEWWCSVVIDVIYYVQQKLGRIVEVVCKGCIIGKYRQPTCEGDKEKAEYQTKVDKLSWHALNGNYIDVGTGHKL